ncbi:MAG TPA: sirohydrochlorin chelatase [Bacillales bacterium]|nr:sirohydrochlorin chelatase [Bacillales bacterium]
MEAVIYIGHGSRRQGANEKFIAFINKVMMETKTEIQGYGFLEHAKPSIHETIEACIQEGASNITVVPILLLPGVHANEDIPAEIEKAKIEYPDISFSYCPPLGSDDILVNILSERLISQGFKKKAGDEAVLLVGHGSREPEAALEFQKLADFLGEKIRFEVQTAFLTTPAFYHEKIEELPNKKIYVLPLLLFSSGFAVKMKNEKIILCDPIGFDDQLIPLIKKRAGIR